MPPLIPQYHPPPTIDQVPAGIHNKQEQPVNYISSLELQPRQDFDYHSQEQQPSHHGGNTDDQEQPTSEEIMELSNEVNIDKDKVNFPKGNQYFLVLISYIFFFILQWSKVI